MPRASGGGAQSPLWRGLLASVLNRRVVSLYQGTT